MTKDLDKATPTQPALLSAQPKPQPGLLAAMTRDLSNGGGSSGGWDSARKNLSILASQQAGPDAYLASQGFVKGHAQPPTTPPAHDPTFLERHGFIKGPQTQSQPASKPQSTFLERQGFTRPAPLTNQPDIDKAMAGIEARQPQQPQQPHPSQVPHQQYAIQSVNPSAAPHLPITPEDIAEAKRPHYHEAPTSDDTPFIKEIGIPTSGHDVGDLAKTLPKSFLKGAAEAGVGLGDLENAIAASLGQKVGRNPLREASQEALDFWDNAIKTDPDQAANIAHRVAGFIGQAPLYTDPALAVTIGASQGAHAQYEQAIASGKTPEQAAQYVIEGGIAGGVAGGLHGKFLESPLAGGMVMGASQIPSNLIEKQYNPDKDLFEGVPEQALSGMLGATAMKGIHAGLGKLLTLGGHSAEGLQSEALKALLPAAQDLAEGKQTGVDRDLLVRYMTGDRLSDLERETLGRQLNAKTPLPPEAPVHFKGYDGLKQAVKHLQTMEKGQEGQEGGESNAQEIRSDQRSAGIQGSSGEAGQNIGGQDIQQPEEARGSAGHGETKRGGAEQKQQEQAQGLGQEQGLGKLNADPNDASVQRWRGANVPVHLDEQGQAAIQNEAYRIPADVQPEFWHSPEARGRETGRLAAQASGGTAVEHPGLQPRDNGLTGQPVTPENTQALVDWTREHPGEPPPWGGEAFDPMKQRVIGTASEALDKTQADDKARVLVMHNSELNVLRGRAAAELAGAAGPHDVHMDTALADSQNEHGGLTRIYRDESGRTMVDGDTQPEDVKAGEVYVMRHGHTPWNGPEAGVEGTQGVERKQEQAAQANHRTPSPSIDTGAKVPGEPQRLPDAKTWMAEQGLKGRKGQAAYKEAQENYKKAYIKWVHDSIQQGWEEVRKGARGKGARVGTEPTPTPSTTQPNDARPLNPYAAEVERFRQQQADRRSLSKETRQEYGIEDRPGVDRAFRQGDKIKTPNGNNAEVVSQTATTYTLKDEEGRTGTLNKSHRQRLLDLEEAGAKFRSESDVSGKLEELGYNKETAANTAKLAQARAEAWASTHNSTPEEWYKTRISRMLSGEEYGKAAKPGQSAMFTPDADGRGMIVIFKNAPNPAIAVHELLHLFASVDMSPEELAIVEKHLGAKLDLNTPEGRQAHETLAREWEAHLARGNAPTGALKEPFEYFKATLTNLYKNQPAMRWHNDTLYRNPVTNVEMKPEMRDWFNKVLLGQGGKGEREIKAGAEAEPSPLSAEKPTTEHPPPPDITSIQNAVTEGERAARGLTPILQAARHGFGEAMDEGQALVDKDPLGFRNKTLQLWNDHPRPLSDTEDAALVYDRMRLFNEERRLMNLGDKARADKNEEGLVSIQEQLDHTRHLINLNDSVARRSGAESGRGLNARKMMLKDDYSLGPLLQRARSATKDGRISPELEDRLKLLADRIQTAMDEMDKHQAQGKPINQAIERIKQEVSKSGGKAAKGDLDAQWAAASRQIAARLGRPPIEQGMELSAPSHNLSPEELAANRAQMKSFVGWAKQQAEAREQGGAKKGKQGKAKAANALISNMERQMQEMQARLDAQEGRQPESEPPPSSTKPSSAEPTSEANPLEAQIEAARARIERMKAVASRMKARSGEADGEAMAVGPQAKRPLEPIQASAEARTARLRELSRAIRAGEPSERVVFSRKGSEPKEDIEEPQTDEERRLAELFSGRPSEEPSELSSAENPLWDPEINKLVGQMARIGVQRDPTITSDGLVGMLHEELSQHLPHLDRREVEEAISGYGKPEAEPRTRSEAEQRLSEIKTEIGQILKQADIRETGEAQNSKKGEPSDAARTGRLRAEIGDLDQRIALREQGEEKQAQAKAKAAPAGAIRKSVSITAQMLEAERNILKRQFEDPAAKNKADVRAKLDEVERRLRENDLSPKAQKGQKGFPRRIYDDNEVAAMREVLEGKQKELQARRMEPGRIEAAQSRLNELQRRIEAGLPTQGAKGEPGQSKQPRQPMSPERQQLKEDIKAAKKELSSLRQEQTAQARTQKDISTLQAMIDEVERTGHASRPQVTPRPVSPEMQQLREARAAKAKELQELERKTPEGQAKQSAARNASRRAALLKEQARLEEGLKTGKFEPKPTRKPLVLEPETMKLKENVERLKQQADDLIRRQELEARHPARKAMDFLLKWRRGMLLSPVETVGKLGSAAMGRIVSSPIEAMIGEGWSHVPSVKGIAEQSARYGRFSGKAEHSALRHIFEKQMWRDIRDKLSTGKTQLDVLYGKKGSAAYSSPEAGGEEPNVGKKFFGLINRALDLPGRAHAAIKAIPFRNEFYRALDMETEAAKKEVPDISDPVVQATITAKAYDHASRAIFLHDNIIPDSFTNAMAALENSKKGQPMGQAAAGVGRYLFPIVKIPSNFLAETTNYIPPVAAARIAARLIFMRGAEGLGKEGADAVMRSLTKGSLGMVMMALGYYNPNSVGGYYQPSHKKGEDEPQFGGLRVFGMNVPRVLVHTPFMEALQIGATLRQIKDQYSAKGKIGTKEAVFGASAPVMEESPFIREPTEIGKALESEKSAEKWAGQQVSSMTSPPDFRRVVEMFDPEHRYPQSFWDEIAKDWPGLRKGVSSRPAGRGQAAQVQQ